MLTTGITPKQICQHLQVQRSHVSEWKTGHRPIPTYHLIALCRWWKMAPGDLVGWTVVDADLSANSSARPQGDPRPQPGEA